MNPEPPERPPFPHIEILPIVDRVINVGLWVGRLFTKQFSHNPPTHGDHFQDPQIIPYPDHESQIGND